MALQEYKRKRKFSKTPEPKGKVKKSKPELPIFVVHKHQATRLHYDVRLEAEGVLKSWAVPKGPSMDPSKRRLAVHVEDHPYEYKDFKGTIPKGEYGAGKVFIWDKGTYEPVKDVVAGIKKGHVIVKFKGKKLKGEFALIKFARAGEDNWLMFKMKES